MAYCNFQQRRASYCLYRAEPRASGYAVYAHAERCVRHA